MRMAGKSSLEVRYPHLFLRWVHCWPREELETWCETTVGVGTRIVVTYTVATLTHLLTARLIM
jgi:hypothetical protein